jgi:hypothetical protein
MAWLDANQIARELECMPRGSFAQNMLRMVFQCRRVNAFGSRPEFPGATVEETLARSRSSLAGRLIHSEAAPFWP